MKPIGYLYGEKNRILEPYKDYFWEFYNTLDHKVRSKVDYVLQNITTQAIVASGSVDNFTGYSATGSTVETLAAERDARERLMVILADLVTAQLYATADLPE